MSATPRWLERPPVGVLVVGGGLAGLTSAAALAEMGASVLIITDPRPGQASPAAAGMLAPSVERARGPADDFAIAARDRYPRYVDWLADRTGVRVPVNREGILQVALDDAGAAALRHEVESPSCWVDAAELARLEPALSHASGAILHPHDGSADNVLLMAALERYADQSPAIEVVHEAAERIELPSGDGDGVTVISAEGNRYAARALILAAGAWTPQIRGLPRPLPVEPVRGQMLAVDAHPLRHVVYGPGGYIVPRESGRTLVGSTMEHVGFDVRTTPDATARLRAAGSRICPALDRGAVVSEWAGLRPVTPDFLPVLGRDPDFPALVYDCGHSRNGILLTPLTGECAAALALGETPSYDLSPFDIARFATDGR